MPSTPTFHIFHTQILDLDSSFFTLRAVLYYFDQRKDIKIKENPPLNEEKRKFQELLVVEKSQRRPFFNEKRVSRPKVGRR